MYILLSSIVILTLKSLYYKFINKYLDNILEKISNASLFHFITVKAEDRDNR